MAARRKRRVDVADLGDVDLLERVVAREDLDDYERDVFESMLERQREREDAYGDDAFPLSELQRGWAERVASREKTRMSGEEFAEFVRERIGRDVCLTKVGPK